MFKARDYESFPLGKGPMVMLILFLVSTIVILARPSGQSEQLEFWGFANTHYEEYQARVPIFEAQHPGVKVRLTNFGGTMHDKLLTALLSNFGAPDMVELDRRSFSDYYSMLLQRGGGFFDQQGLVNRYEKTRIIPPPKVAWDAPIFSEPDPYLGGQPLGKLFTQLALDIPPLYQNPYWSEAADLFNDAIFAVVTQKQTPEVAIKVLAQKVRALMRKDQQRWGEM